MNKNKTPLKSTRLMTAIATTATLFASQALLAYSWPSFWAPDRELMMKHHALRTATCPQGQAKLIPGMLFSIQETCNTWCPKDWYWFTHITDQCLPLSAFQLQDYQFESVSEPGHDHVLYTKITAFYGQDKSSPAFTLTFTTPPEAWHCYAPHGAPGMVDCANDI